MSSEMENYLSRKKIYLQKVFTLQIIRTHHSAA